MNQPGVGFSMHPRWAFGGALSDFLEPLRAAGLRALEFGLWDYDPDWPRFLPLMEDCRRLGFALCFHAPYLAPYTIAGYAGKRREEIQAAYAPMFDIAARFAPTTVVIHGAGQEKGRSLDRLRADTMAFLEWALARYPGLTLALENLVPNPSLHRVGPIREELLQVVTHIDSPRLGICWDMGHDARAGHADTPDAAWLQHGVHAHLHDINEDGIDHYPLLYGRVPYPVWLPALARAGFSGVVTLEIKGSYLSHLEFEQVKRILSASIAEVAWHLTALEGAEGSREAC